LGDDSLFVSCGGSADEAANEPCRFSRPFSESNESSAAAIDVCGTIVASNIIVGAVLDAVAFASAGGLLVDGAAAAAVGSGPAGGRS
jgi:hypothetical protein